MELRKSVQDGWTEAWEADESNTAFGVICLIAGLVVGYFGWRAYGVLGAGLGFVVGGFATIVVAAIIYSIRKNFFNGPK